MTTNNNIKDCVLEIHTDPVINYNEFNELFKTDKNKNEKYNFGILKLEMKETKIIKDHIFIEFTIDRSASMDELCKDSNTKMHHLKKTLINIIEYIANVDDNINVYIQVDMFDDKVDTCIEYVKVDKNNYTSLIESVKNITSRGSTNIGAALENAQNVILKKINEYPSIKPYHIFLTDGYPTIGNSSNTQLMEFICYEYANIMIGVGTDHNYRMLQEFASKNKSEYRFIDNGENSGLVYGEVLQKIIRPAIEDIVLTITEGELYDWRKDSWTNVLNEDVIDSESTKIYHIRTKTPYTTEIQVNGIVSGTTRDKRLLSKAEAVPDLEDYNTNETYYTNLSKYIYRQKTLELLSICKKYKDNRHTDEAKDILKILSKFFKNMRTYMRENQLLNDSFMILLCDDIVVAYKTLGTRNSQMYCGARQVSQGSQYSYAPNYDDDCDEDAFCPNAPIKRNVFKRAVNFKMSNQMDEEESILFKMLPELEEPILENNEEQDNIDNYISSSSSNIYCDSASFAYSTPSKTQIMRSISKK